MHRLILFVAVAALAQEPQARVLGKPISARGTGPDQAKQLAYEIRSSLMEHYEKLHHLEATEAEIEAVRARLGPADDGSERLRQDLLRAGVAEAEVARRVQSFKGRAAAQRRHWELALIRWWKVGKSLFERYGGGRVRLSAFGFQEPVDAMIRFLHDEEAAGRLSFADASIRERVLAEVQNGTGDGIVSGAKAREIFVKPLWEQPR